MPGRMQSNLKQLLGASPSHTLKYPKVDDVHRSDHRPEIERISRALGGTLVSIPLNLRPWDMEFEGIAVELDECLHFNCYRGITLNSKIYERLLSEFPLKEYQSYCSERSEECRSAGSWGKRWSNESSKIQFGGACQPRRSCADGATRWKQRAFYDFVKDLSPSLLEVPVARIAIWDTIVVDGRAITVEEILTDEIQGSDKAPTREIGAALAALVRMRAPNCSRQLTQSFPMHSSQER